MTLFAYPRLIATIEMAHGEGLLLPKCILLVDDSAIVRTGLRRAFEFSGWEVCGEAANGREGIEKAERLKPHLIVLDLAMPEMNGISAARVLRRTMPKVPLILFTTYGEMIAVEDAREAGISEIVPKSEPIKVLLQVAERLVSSAAA